MIGARQIARLESRTCWQCKKSDVSNLEDMMNANITMQEKNDCNSINGSMDTKIEHGK